MKGGVIMQELDNITTGVVEYLTKAHDTVKPLMALIVTLLNYILFPDEAYKSASVALCLVVILDIITKYYYYARKCKGIGEAIRTRAINSDTLWNRSKRKVISYLVVMILAGLSIRVTMLTQVAVFLSTVAYSIMFLRECQSVLENLIDAGHTELDWFLVFVKNNKSKVLKENDIIENNTEENNTEDKNTANRDDDSNNEGETPTI